MSSKDKLIGVVLILLGVGFIALGVVYGGKMQATGTDNQVYQEQQLNDTEGENEFTTDPTVNIYSESEENVEEQEVVDNQGESEEEGTNRYIY